MGLAEGLMVELDVREEMALKEFLQILEIQHFDPKPKVVQSRIHRGPEGKIIVPVTIQAKSPSLSLALLMAIRPNISINKPLADWSSHNVRPRTSKT